MSYLDLRGFGHAEVVGAAYDSVVSLLAGTNALILDLRQNGGVELFVELSVQKRVRLRARVFC
ncbi:hypothetical protein [Rhodanobacter sp. C01]|uniref:hypothetical protein n=1 Tax=Rhodanobacter sp. C01 TaxID=1945856 RepID=UPI00098436C6|nr:hypothetical protein [Rhodanobacter sp. C01]OOG47694.1 hypothetical protein B0E50_09495 [Rhodanobacter sp. C01]